MPQVNPRKVVLAYSGGLDTSAIAAWLMQERGCEVVTYTADIGQGEEVEPARQLAEALGVREIFIEDLREEFARDFIFPMFRANALYEGEYLLGTAIARPLIARRLVAVAHQVGADAIAHGATGRGNDQVRFELAALALAPELQVVAPWREWDFKGRKDLVDYCRRNQIPVQTDGKGEPLCSMDANLLHVSYEGGHLEDPAQRPQDAIWLRTRSIADAPDEPTEITLGFAEADPVSINGTVLAPGALMEELNRLAGENGIGRLDMVENRYVGVKSRGCYETPGGTVLSKARRALESIVLDAGLAHLRDSLSSRYAELVYNGYWFSDERRALQQLMDYSCKWMEGEVVVRLHKGNVQVLGRSSEHSLYSEEAVSFEGAGDERKADASGFIRLHSASLRASAQREGSIKAESKNRQPE